MTPAQRFRSYIAPYRGRLIAGALFILLANLAKLAAPFVLGRVVDELTVEVTGSKLLRYGLLIVLIGSLQALFLFLQQRTFIHISRHFEYDIRNDFYAHLQKLPSRFYQQYRTGDLMARAMNDISVVRMLASAGVMFAVNTVFILLLIIPVMLSISWLLTLLTFLLMPLVAVATQGFSKRIHARAGEVQEYVGMVANRAQESLSNVRVTRAYTQERSEIEGFESVNREAVARNIRLARLTSLFTPTLQFIVETGSLLVLCGGGALVVKGVITIGQFVQFTIYTGFLIYPMIELGSVISVFQRAKVSMGRIDEVMSEEPARSVARGAAGDVKLAGEIEFRDLTFSYPGADEPVLKGVNLHIAPGQTIGILGTIGSGKSTLMQLVPRLLDAAPGQVLIDGRPAEEIPLEVLRTAIGYVPQESFLFSETLAGNICFGLETATREEIERAAAEAELEQDIETAPQGYATVLGERGITLSGGQKQRLAIARALIRRPRILLLDDALSSVDTYTEERILKNLRRLMRSCTILLISHRISTVKHADAIVILENGSIVERGTHHELLAHGGVYAGLYEKQVLEEELQAS
ncbi:MAG: ATP-binding cassette, subfamily multidrug efflux pump [Acidobacteriota bacterium]|jgi:ATP-binding cassette subfamily B protein|nr:ATP-binding cassette, subfamily multidrug efflux pump [Acidobacteriota bacterium]